MIRVCSILPGTVVILAPALASAEHGDIVTASVAGLEVALIRLKTLLPFFPFSLEFPPGPPLTLRLVIGACSRRIARTARNTG